MYALRILPLECIIKTPARGASCSPINRRTSPPLSHSEHTLPFYTSPNKHLYYHYTNYPDSVIIDYIYAASIGDHI